MGRIHRTRRVNNDLRFPVGRNVSGKSTLPSGSRATRLRVTLTARTGGTVHSRYVPHQCAFTACRDLVTPIKRTATPEKSSVALPFVRIRRSPFAAPRHTQSASKPSRTVPSQSSFASAAPLPATDAQHTRKSVTGSTSRSTFIRSIPQMQSSHVVLGSMIQNLDTSAEPAKWRASHSVPKALKIAKGALVLPRIIVHAQVRNLNHKGICLAIQCYCHSSRDSYRVSAEILKGYICRVESRRNPTVQRVFLVFESCLNFLHFFKYIFSHGFQCILNVIRCQTNLVELSQYSTISVNKTRWAVL